MLFSLETILKWNWFQLQAIPPRGEMMKTMKTRKLRPSNIPLPKRDFYRRTRMIFGPWDHFQTRELFAMQTLVSHFIVISPSSGVWIFSHHPGLFNDRFFRVRKRVTWKSIKAANTWYIKEKFLIHHYTLENPARLSESALRAYWKLWYDLAKGGHPFTFQRVGTPADTSGGPSKPPSKSDAAGSQEEPSNDEGQDKARGKKHKQISPSDTTGVSTDSESGTDPEKELLSPKACTTDAEKLTFLWELAGSSDKDYQATVALVAQMGVSACFTLKL